MKTSKSNWLAVFLAIIFCSCATGRYIHDPNSIERQKEMHQKRTGTTLGDIALQVINLITLTAFNTDLNPETTPRSFKRIKIFNESPDTLRINMVTNVFWKEDQYNDIRDIRIPPQLSTQLMVPMNADYNVYFRGTLNGKDEMIPINTSKKRKIRLRPGMTLVGEKKP